tara:strand:- start:42959 stop:43216 length:258 start_codon:yes stop_codon:yes gene_type:complete
MNVINTIIKTPWGKGRWIRLGLGIAFLMDAYAKQSGLVALMGTFLIYQAAFNTGCGFGNTDCAPTQMKKNENDISHNFIELPKRK